MPTSAAKTIVATPVRPAFPAGGVLQRACACGGTPGPTGECAQCRRRRLVRPHAGSALQPKLRVNAPGDRYEREAEAIADRTVRNEAAPVPTPITPLIQRSGGDGAATAPPIVHDVLASPGRPLDQITRAFMEPRLGHDLDGVRIHTNAQAAASAQAVQARAYTVGRHVVFGAGEYRPSTLDGRRLLAHELVHVAQQRTYAGQENKHVQRQVSPDEDQVQTVPFPVSLTRILSNDELLVELVRQHLRVTLEVARQEVAQGWSWEREPSRPITEADVERGYRIVWLRDATGSLRASTRQGRRTRSQYFRQLPSGTQARLNAEADRRFWEGTNYRPGEQLGTSPADRVVAFAWRRYRDQVTREHQEVAALPEAVREALFNQYATESISPADYPQLLRIARRLQELPPVQLADYGNRISATSSSLDAVENSVDRYLALLREREEQRADYRRVETRLYGMQELYRLYKLVRATNTVAALPAADEFGVRDLTVARARQEAPTLEARLREGLRQNNFSSVADFEATLRLYVSHFRRQALSTATDMLDRLDGELFRQQRRYEATAAPSELLQRLAGTQARQFFDQARSSRGQLSMMRPDPDLHRYLPRELEMRQRLLEEATESQFAGSAEVRSVAGPDVLLTRSDFPHEQLARATSASGARGVLIEYIRQKREAVEDTHDNIADDPDLVLKLDEVVAATYQALEINPGSIYDEIIQDHLRDIATTEALLGVARGLLALFAALIGGAVGGPVGAGAALVGVGIGVDEAVRQFRDWETQSEAHEAGLLSDDPSFGWVILAVVGAGLDLAGAVAAVRAMRPAVQTFNASGDVAALERALARLAEVDDAMRANILRAAEEKNRFERAVQGLLASSGRLNAVVIPGAEEFARLVHIAYLGARRGIVRFERFLLELQAQNLIDDVENLTGAPLQRYREAFEQGVEQASQAGTYTTRINWGIHSIDARPHGPGYWGRRIRQSDARVDAYELRINPSDESYYLPHPDGGFVQFEDLAASVVQDGKLIQNQRSFYHVADLPPFARQRVLEEARRQVAAAQHAGLSVEWLVSEQRAVDQLRDLFAQEGIAIDLRFFPE